MKHRMMTCKNHPTLRWSAKDVAVGGVNPGDPALYNGSRKIFFDGNTTGELYEDKSGVRCTFGLECLCPADCLIIAPEDALIR